MLNKNVCPKCGQLFDTGMDRCPLCGLPVQTPPTEEAPVQRRRITEAERRQRRQEQRLATSEARRRERDARRAADAEEERKLQAEEARAREERMRSRLEKKGYSADEAERRAADGTPKNRKARGSQGGIPNNMLILSIVLCAIAILIGSLYLLWRARGGGKTASSGSASGDCTAITLNTDAVELKAAGETFTLTYSLSPADCKQDVTFESSDTEVVDVGAKTGVITAKQPGMATITAVCGTRKASCAVNCDFGGEEESSAPTELVLPDGLKLSSTDITFFNPNESTYLHVENVPNGTIIEWASDDMTVAVVEPNGHVIAVSKGTCNIIATVGEYSAKCIVRCNFKD